MRILHIILYQKERLLMPKSYYKKKPGNELHDALDQTLRNLFADYSEEQLDLWEAKLVPLNDYPTLSKKKLKYFRKKLEERNNV